MASYRNGETAGAMEPKVGRACFPVTGSIHAKFQFERLRGCGDPESGHRELAMGGDFWVFVCCSLAIGNVWLKILSATEAGPGVMSATN